MALKFINNLAIIVFLLMFPEGAIAQSWQEASASTNQAIIVVTGMKLNSDTAYNGKDLSVAEDAVVKITAGNGESREKRTEVFTRTGLKKGDVFFTADFPVNLDSTYNISMTFKNGTVIRIDDYRLPAVWKTHFFFHSTVRTSSPASVLRKAMDEQTRLCCYIYALFPSSNYKALGGTQVK